MDRYQKLKDQYLSLKNKYYNIVNLNKINQTGGKLFQKKQILYIVTTISQKKLKQVTKEITDTILGKDIKPYRAPHITLFNLIIDAENPDSAIFQNEKFYSKIKNYYAETIALKTDPLILQAVKYPRDYSFPGSYTGFKPSYFIKNYKPDDRTKIINFRNKIFDLIESILGKPKISDHLDNRGKKYHMYSFNGKQLFAESTYYDVWKPHLNFLNDFDIEKHNPQLQKVLNEQMSKADKIDILLDKIKDVVGEATLWDQEIYNTINMSTQMKNITYAIDHIMIKKFKV